MTARHSLQQVLLALLALALLLAQPLFASPMLPIPTPPRPDYTPPPLEAPVSWRGSGVPLDIVDRSAPAPAPAAPAQSVPDPLERYRFGGFLDFCEWFIVFLLIAPGTFPALGFLFLSCAQFLRRKAGVPIPSNDLAYNKVVKEVKSDDDPKVVCLEKAT